MFHEGDLQSGIGLAVQQSKAVLCFVYDGSETSSEWETALKDGSVSPAITEQTVALRLQAGSPEASFLAPIVTINSIPAIIMIKNAQLQVNLQSAEINVQDLKDRLAGALGVQQEQEQTSHTSETPDADGTVNATESTHDYLDLPPAPGQMRLPNNAYDALRTHTQRLVDEGTPATDIFTVQLSLLSNIPIFKDEVTRLRASSTRKLSEYARSRLLRLPAVGLKIPGQSKASPPSQVSSSTPQPESTTPAASTPTLPTNPADRTTRPTPTPPQIEPDKQKSQRADYIKLQREREQKQRDERERIKAQIKADREERRRLDDMRKGINDGSADSNVASSSNTSRSQLRNKEVRVQVRTFDGTTLRSIFQPSSSLSKDIRPWIDTESGILAPYNLKLIMTPLPNRNIEAAEEEHNLSDLGIIGSCTLVMVPVKGYVESYTGSTPGSLLGSAVSGGFSLVTGTAGAVFGGVKSMLGYGQPSQSAPSSTSDSTTTDIQVDGPKVRVRTLADQRIESAAKRKDHQLYNGNQLNFEPKKDDDRRGPGGVGSASDDGDPQKRD